MRLKGWKHILAFTYIQTLKTKSFKVGTVITCVLTALFCAGINVLPALLSGNGGIFVEDVGSGEGDDAENEEPASVNALYVYSDNELSFELSPVEDVEYIYLDESGFAEKKEEIISGEEPEMLLYIYSGEGEDFYLTYYRPENEVVLPEYIAGEYADRFTEAFTKAMYLSIGVGEDDLPLAQAGIYSYMAVNGGGSWIQEMLDVILPMAFAVIFYMYIVIYAQLIAQSMAVEKSSKVIELLITSARPLAIIAGKIAGTLLICLTQVAVIGAAGGIAFVATAPFALITAANAAPELGGAAELLGGTVEGVGADGILISEGSMDIGAELSNALPGLFNAGAVIAVIITLILGFLFFALLAGLVGASVSRMEDLAGALQPMMLLAVAGFILSYLPAALNFDGSAQSVVTFSHFFPISSPFALPSAILMGNMGAIEIVAAIALLAVLTLLTVLLTAKVYEGMILYSGNPLKPLQILKMAKKR